MKIFLLVLMIVTVGMPSMTSADEKEMNSREVASVSAKKELTAAQEKNRKELNAKIEKIILSEVKFKN